MTDIRVTIRSKKWETHDIISDLVQAFLRDLDTALNKEGNTYVGVTFEKTTR